MAKKTQKTHKGTKKVLNVRQSGSITIGHPGSRHNTGKKNSAYNRGKTTSVELNKSDAKRLKRIIDTL
jgi:ribosomal protein L35